jgi:hypothetical protein
MVEASIRRHDTFNVHENCITYPAAAASMTRKLFAEQWRSTLIRIITSDDLTVDPTVLDKYVAYLGIFNYMYDPLTDLRENPIGRAALDVAAPTVPMRNHARKHGLPGMPGLLLDAFLTGGVLPEDVATSMNDRVRNFDAEFQRAHGGGGLTGVAQQMGAVARCLGPNVMPTTPEEVIGLWGPLLRVMLPYRGICQLPMGKVGHLKSRIMLTDSRMQTTLGWNAGCDQIALSWFYPSKRRLQKHLLCFTQRPHIKQRSLVHRAWFSNRP